MSTCFWSSYESNTWEPLPVAEEQPNHVSRKISGRKITANNGLDCLRDSGRYNQGSGRSSYVNHRSHQSHDHVSFRSNDFDFTKSGQQKVSFMRQNSNQGDGRWNDRNVAPRGFVAGMSRLSVRGDPGYNSFLENCFEQLKITEKFRLEKEMELTTSYPNKKVTSNNSIPVSRIGVDGNRVERLISDSFKEQARISTLVSAMDLYHTVHLGVYSAIQAWLDSIHKLQTAYKQQMIDIHEAGDRPDLVPGGNVLLALEKLCCRTRAARTAFWSAYINFITNEWKEARARNDDADARREMERGGGEEHATGDPAPNKPVSEVCAAPAPLMTKTGRPLIPFTLQNLPAP